MVDSLTHSDLDYLDEALKLAEQKTSAKISIVVRPASGAYREYILVYSLVFGSAVTILLWDFAIVRNFLWLLSIQLGIVALCDIAHSIGNIFVPFVPRKVRHHFGAQAAMREYHELHAQQPHDAPFVLLFVSLAERYVHVVTNPVVHKRLPGNWNKITESFTHSVRHHSLRAACAEAAGHIAEILAIHFPA
ncbi:MAG: hypothetical protein WCD70_01405 [Alphaproteobacteria bacterium]